MAQSEAKNNLVIDDMDKAYELAGTQGRYKLLVAAASWTSVITLMMFMSSVPYFLLRPSFQCDRNGSWTDCSYEEACSDRRYRYVESRFFNFVTEFDLLCEEEKSAVVSSAFFFGSMLSCLFVNLISDIWGRLVVLTIGNIANIVCVVVFMMWSSYEMAMVVSGMLGFFLIGNNANSYAFIYDSFQSKDATFHGTALSVAWGLGEVSIALTMWTGIQWRGMCMVMVGISIFYLALLFWVRESPRFYFSKKHFDKALKALRHIAAINHVKLPEGLVLSHPSAATTESRTSLSWVLKAIFCNRGMLGRILLFTYCFSTSTFVYYALSLNIQKMSGSIYLIGLGTAIGVIVSSIFSGALISRIGPRASLVLYFGITGGSMALQGFFWESSTVSLVCACLTKFSINAAENSLYIFVAELFPTAIKGGAFGVAIFLSRISSILSTPLSLLNPLAMCLVNTGLCLAASLVSLLLPTTTGAILDISRDDDSKAEPFNTE